jgi:hypothetical protein
MILRFCKTVALKGVKWAEQQFQQWTKRATASPGVGVT